MNSTETTAIKGHDTVGPHGRQTTIRNNRGIKILEI